MGTRFPFTVIETRNVIVRDFVTDSEKFHGEMNVKASLLADSRARETKKSDIMS